MRSGRKLDLGFVVIVVLLCAAQVAVWYQVVLAKEERFDEQMGERLQQVINILREDALCAELYSQWHVSENDEFFLIAPFDSGSNKADTVSSYWQMVDSQSHMVERSSFEMALPAIVDLSVRLQFMVPQDRDPETVLSEFQEEAVKELENSLLTKVGGNVIKLIDTALLRNTVMDVFMTRPVQEVRFAVIDRESNEFKFTSNRSFDVNQPNTVRASIFSAETQLAPWDLLVAIPDKRLVFMRATAPILLVTFLIVGMLLFWFWHVRRSILAKKRLANMQLDLVSSITHEFSTPITNISFALETINKGETLDNTEREGLLKMIDEANTRMDSNVKKILAVTLFQDEKFILEKEPHDIHEILDRAAEMSKPTLQKNACTLKKNYGSEDPWVDVDANYMVNVISSLIENSVKHGGGEVHIELGTKDIEQGVLVEVKDNGRGIPFEERVLVFDKFYRVNDKNGEQVNGTGIGLYFAKLAIEAHGGKIEALEQLSGGTNMMIRLKRNELHED